MPEYEFKYLKFPYTIDNPSRFKVLYQTGSSPSVLNIGDSITFNDPCTLLKFINTAKWIGPNQQLAPVVLSETTTTIRYQFDELCDFAARGGCEGVTCSSVIFSVDTPATKVDEGGTREDSGDAQGSPTKEEPVTGHTQEPLPPSQRPRDNPPSPEYNATTKEEEQKQPQIPPHGGEISNETTEGGDPVDLYRGAFTIQEADLVVPNTVLPLVMARTYRSGHPFPGPFSWNWDHNHNIYLRELLPAQGATTGDVARWNGHLHEDLFHWNGQAFDPPRGIFQKLEKLPLLDPNGEYAIRDVGGVSWYFGRPNGWSNAFRIPLLRVVDRFGNALEYSYDSEDRLEWVHCKPVDAAGAQSAGPYHYLHFIYGTCGLLEHVIDSLGRQVDYLHDPDVQHLVGVKYPVTPDHPEGMQRAYHYSGLHLPEMLRHNIVRVEDGQGKIYVENLYDEDPSSWSYGHVLRQVHGGNTFQFRYTPLQWLPPRAEYVNVPTQRTEVIDPEGGLTTYTFNFRGNILDRRTRLAKDGSYWITATAFEYDSQGNLTRTQHIREFEEKGEGNTVHVWGLGEARTYHHDHADPRMRGMVKKVESLDGTMRETVWEGTYDPNLQLVLSERGPIGDGFTAAQVMTTYQYSADNKGKLERINHPSVTLPDGTTQTAVTQFETNGRGQTTKVITPEGIEHRLVYDESAGLGLGRLIRKVADAGTGGLSAEQSFAYDSYGFIQTVTDPTGAVTTYAHNALGQMRQVTSPSINGAAPTTVMRYDADGLLVEVGRPRGSYADTAISGDHIVDRIVRNVLGHVVQSEIGANTATPRLTERIVDHRGLPKQSTDPLGTISTWKWDERGLLFHHEANGRDGAHAEERYVYMRDGRLQREVHGPAKDIVAEYVYGPFGRISRVHQLHRAPDGASTPSGATSRSYWSDRGYLDKQEMRAYPGLDTDQLLSRTEYKYDARGRLIEQTERPFSADAPFVEATTPKLTTKFFYDRNDRLVKVIDPRGGVMTYKHDGLNRTTEEADPVGNKTVYTYSFVDRSVHVTHHDIETDGVTVRQRIWKRRSDARGRLVEAEEPDGALTKFEYDDRDLLTATIDRDGKRREYTYGLLNEPLTDTLDPAGLNIVNERSYDLVGRMTAYKDPSGQITTYTYDGIGRLVGSRQPGDAAPRAMIYGNDGRLAESRLPSGLALRYTYDTAGRIATVNAANIPAGVGVVPQHSYSYDLLGRLTTATAGASTVTRAYDSLGRLLKETTHGQTLEAVYNDLAGTVVKKWPDGRQETLTMNLNGVVTKIERTANGTLGAGGAVLGDFTPYGPSLIGKASLLGGVDTTITYDERKRVSRIEHKQAGTTFEDIEYRYDKLDRRRVELVKSGTVQSRLHLFDTHRRLTETREGSATVALGTNGYTQANNDTDIAAVETALNVQNPQPIKYEYLFIQLSAGKADERLTFRKTDSAGTVTTTSYSYNNGHRLSGAGAETVTHLADGTRSVDANNRYEVDAFGRVTAVKDPTGAITRTTLEYDPLGRVGSITPGAGNTRKLSYFGGTLWQERETAGVVRQFSHHPGMPGPLAAHVAGQSYLLHHDARLNLTAVTDSTGALGQRFRYEPFGAPTPTTSATGIEPRFGGMRWLNDAELYLAGARMMDPRHGLWLSHDPLGYVDSPNLYAYAGQNPIDFADPSGLAAGKGGGTGNSDGGAVEGPGGGALTAVSKHISMPGGTSGRSLIYGAGDGPGIEGPKWLMDVTDSLRTASNDVRDWFDKRLKPLKEMGVVGAFLAGAAKRVFDYALLMSPFSYAVAEEEFSGMVAMYGMGVDAMYNPHPERYERLGKMISGMPEYLAHMSAEEWGSLTVDMLPALISGGVTTARLVRRIGGALARRLPKAVVRAAERGLGRLGAGALRSGGDRLLRTLGPARINHPEELAATIERIDRAGGTIEWREDALAFSPRYGEPGTVILDPDASISAVRHEAGHFFDDLALGHPGLGYYLENPIVRWQSEFSSYIREIRLARRLGDTEAAWMLLQDARAERLLILPK